MPACTMSFAHSMHGLYVQYMIALFEPMQPNFASFMRAFDSACKTSLFVTIESSAACSQQFENPAGMPL